MTDLDLVRGTLPSQDAFVTRAIRLAKTAERVRTDPDDNLEHCAVRWSAETLRARLDERMTASPSVAMPGRDVDGAD